MEWIKTEDRLPEEGGVCVLLGYFKVENTGLHANKIHKGYLYEGKMLDWDTQNEIDMPTHWHFLPPPLDISC